MNYTTQKGTTLLVVNIKGQQYLPVAQRLIWFREEKPDWGIKTMLLKYEQNYCIAQAEVFDEKGVLKASAHKMETAKGFPDFIEKSETGAIGRALALCGYGTQFCADELDEGQRLADSPVQKPQEPKKEVKNFAPQSFNSSPNGQGSKNNGGMATTPLTGDYLIKIGKYKGRTFGSFKPDELLKLDQYIEWLCNDATEKGKILQGSAKELVDAYDSFYGTPRLNNAEQIPF